MGTYLRNDSGQFNGSVGAGATHIPTAPPTAPPAATSAVAGQRPVMPGAIPPQPLTREEVTDALALMRVAQDAVVAAYAETLGWHENPDKWDLNEEENACYEAGVARGYWQALRLLASDDLAAEARSNAKGSLSWIQEAQEEEHIRFGEEARELMLRAKRNIVISQYLSEGYTQDEAAAAAYLEHPDPQ